MRNLFLFFICLLFFYCQSNPKDNVQDVDPFFESFYQESLALYRIKGTFQGDPRYNDTLPNFLSPEFEEKAKAFY